MSFKIFSFSVIIASVWGMANGRGAECAAAVIEGAGATVSLLLTLAGLLCFWNGAARVLEKSRFPSFLSRLLSPLLSALYPDTKRIAGARENVSMLFCANLLGLGNAATPLALSAMRSFDTEDTRVPDGMVMLSLTSCAPISLVPTTVLSVLKSGGSTDPLSVLPAVWLCSSLSFLCAVLLAKGYCFFRKHTSER